MRTGDFEQFVHDNQHVTDFSCNGKCSGCGNCCSNYITLTESDIRRIKGYIRIHHVDPVSHGTGPTLQPVIDMMCPFLNHESRCNIYEARPAICRQFQCNHPDTHYSASTPGTAMNMRATFFSK